MITWGAYREQIQAAVLRDVDSATWTKEVLLTVFGWALKTLATHTAREASVTYTVTGVSLPLPADMSGRLEDGSMIYNTTSAGKQVYFKAWEESPDAKTAYYTWASRIYHPETATGTLTILYFADWEVPVSDSDLLALPQWSYTPLQFLVSAYALTSVGNESANIRQWEERDSERNALREQQINMLNLYDREIARHKRQIRQSHFGWAK